MGDNTHIQLKNALVQNYISATIILLNLQRMFFVDFPINSKPNSLVVLVYMSFSLTLGKISQIYIEYFKS